jgi:hypothetical protein
MGVDCIKWAWLNSYGRGWYQMGVAYFEWAWIILNGRGLYQMDVHVILNGLADINGGITDFTTNTKDRKEYDGSIKQCLCSMITKKNIKRI